MLNQLQDSLVLAFTLNSSGERDVLVVNVGLDIGAADAGIAAQNVIDMRTNLGIVL